MNDGLDSRSERLEKMLRRWGAEEAAEHVRVGAAPVPRLAAGRRLWRWAPLAGAAAVLAAAGVVFMAAPARQPEAAPGPGVAGLEGRIESLAEQLAQALQEAASARADLAKATAALDSQAALFATEADALEKRLRREFDDQRTALMLRLSLQQDESAKVIAAKTAEVERLSESLKGLEETRKQLAAALRAAEEWKGKQAEAARRLAAAAGELDRMGKAHELAAADRRAAREELLTLRARQAALVMSFQQAYLAAAAPGQTGLAARQTAARRSRMVEQCGQARPSASEPTGRLIDQLEVVFTRLDMLDAADPRAVRSFTALVDANDLAGRIERALEAPQEDARVRVVLLEAKLILTGAYGA